MKKRPKSEVDYSRGMGKTRCKNCVHFEPDAMGTGKSPAACRRVIGIINPEFWCELFKEK